MNQIWKDIRGFEDDYAVTDDGRVWNKRQRMFMKLYNDRGWLSVTLNNKKSGAHKTKRVHILVFEAFYRRLLPNEVVHHLNHIKNQNNLTNLVAWDKKRHRDYHANSEITKSKINYWKGKKLSQETKKKKSEAMKRYYLTHPQKLEEKRKQLVNARAVLHS